MSDTGSGLRDRIGQELGVSAWLEVSQDMIDTFADATQDHQFIHVDPERARAESPFGGTIAHGFLTLSLLSRMAEDVDMALPGMQMGVNYGFDRVRLISPVKAGAKIRGRFVLEDLTEKAPGQWLLKLGTTVEIEGVDKPALTADWLGMQFTKMDG